MVTVAFAPDGNTLASSSDDETIKLWDMNPNDANYGACLQTLDVADFSIAFSPDGQTLAAGGLDGLELWDLASPLSGVTITSNPTAPQLPGTPITLAASLTGGASVQYQFWVYNPSAPSWSQLQSSSTSATCTWTPEAPGNYLLSVTALDITGAEVSATSWYHVTDLTGVTLQVSPAAPQPPGAPITLTATANGGANVQYQFWAYNPSATPAWSELQAIRRWQPAPGRRL